MSPISPALALLLARVREVADGWPGVQVVTCDWASDDGASSPGPLPPVPGWLPAGTFRALSYLDLTGAFEPGDLIWVNATALLQNLGTGGHAIAVAPASPARRLPLRSAGQLGHIVKARYTPVQATVLAVEEDDSPHRAAMAGADRLGGMPVVIADLHSALAPILAGVRATWAGARVAYVMTDGAALPLAYSRAVAGLSEAKWLLGTVTTGQAFGGDLEAVSLHSGLLAARHVLGADIAIVAQGPGNAGTGTPWGFSGAAAGEAVNAASVLGGRPVAALRCSGADARPEHRGVSHHSLTAYGRVALRPADVPIPDWTEDMAEIGEQVDCAVGRLIEPAGIHHAVSVTLVGLSEAIAASPVPVSSMGRGYADDPVCFLVSAAAGRHAANLASG